MEISENLDLVKLLVSSKLVKASSLVSNGRLATYGYNVIEFGHCSEHESLIVEALLTWRTITLYGLALDYYNSARPSLITRLQQEANTHIRSSIICLLSAFLSAAASGGNSKPSVTFRYQAHIEPVLL